MRRTRLRGTWGLRQLARRWRRRRPETGAARSWPSPRSVFRPHLEPLESRRLLAIDAAAFDDLADRGGPFPPGQLAEDFGHAEVDLAGLFQVAPGLPLEFEVESATPGPVAASVAGGVLRLDSVADQSGTAEIVIHAKSLEDAAERTLTLDIAPVNDPPLVASADTLAERSWRVPEGGSPALLDMSTWFIDPERATLTYRLQTVHTSEAGDPVEHWSVDGAQLRLDLADDLHGFGQYTVSASDGEFATSTTFWLFVDPVDDAPRGSLPDQHHGLSALTTGDVAPVVLDLWQYFNDPEDGPRLSYQLGAIDGPETFSVSPSIDAEGFLTYTPTDTENFSADATIRVRATDSAGQTSERSFQVHVHNGERGPTPLFRYPAGFGEVCRPVMSNGGGVVVVDDQGQVTGIGPLFLADGQSPPPTTLLAEGEGDGSPLDPLALDDSLALPPIDERPQTTVPQPPADETPMDEASALDDEVGADDGDEPVERPGDPTSDAPAVPGDEPPPEDAASGDETEEGSTSPPDVEQPIESGPSDSSPAPNVPAPDEPTPIMPAPDESGSSDSGETSTSIEPILSNPTPSEPTPIGSSPDVEQSPPPPIDSNPTAPTSPTVPESSQPVGDEPPSSTSSVDESTMVCETIEQELTWSSALRWEGLRSGDRWLVPLNDDFDGASHELVMQAVHPLVAGLGAVTPAGPSVSVAELQAVPDHVASLTDGIWRGGQDEPQPFSLVVESLSNLPYARRLDGTVRWEIPAGVQVWRSDRGRWVPVVSGEAYSIQLTIQPTWLEEGTVLLPGDASPHVAYVATSVASGRFEERLQIEGLALGAGLLRAHIEFDSTGDDATPGPAADDAPTAPSSFSGTPYVAEPTLAYQVVHADLDGDGDGDGVVEVDDPVEDAVEDDDDRAGVLVPVNYGDRDEDGVPDGLDGVDRDGVPGTDDDRVDVADSKFVPVVITIPEGLDLELARLRFHFDDDEVSAWGWPAAADDLPAAERVHGGLRLWTADQTSPRTDRDANDPLTPGHRVHASAHIDNPVAPDSSYTLRQLAGVDAILQGSRQFTLYVEGRRPGRFELGVLISVHSGTLESQSYTFRDTIALTVYDEVVLHATDRVAQETPPGAPRDNGQFMVSRGEGNVVGDVTVYLRVVTDTRGDASALDGVALEQGSGAGRADYLTWTLDPVTHWGQVTIPDGRWFATIDIEPIDDELAEWDETVRLELVPWEEYAAAFALPDGVAPGDGTLGDRSPYVVATGGAADSVTILDNDGVGAGVSRNRDEAVLDDARLSVGEGAVAVELAEATLTLESTATGLLYNDDDGLAPVVTIDVALPFSDTLRAADLSALRGTLTFAGIVGEEVEFAVEAVRRHFDDTTEQGRAHTGTPVELVVLGPIDLAARLSTGHYDFDLVIDAQFGERAVERTIRGSTEAINRVDSVLGEVDLGARWSLAELDRLAAADGVTPPARHGDNVGAAVSRLAVEGARAESGLALVRGDNSSAWFSATPLEPDRSLVATAATVERGEGKRWIKTAEPLPNGQEGESMYGLVNAGGLSGREDTIRWTFPGIEPNHPYQVFVSWVPAPGRAENASFRIGGAAPLGGGSTTTEVLVDERFSPGESTLAGRPWRSLGFFVLEGGAGGALTIDLSTRALDGTFANGAVAISQVMLVDQWEFSTPDGSVGRLATAASASGADAPPGAWLAPDAWLVWSDPLGNVEVFSAQGLLDTRLDRNHNRTVYHYQDVDADGRIDELERIERQGGESTRFVYAANRVEIRQENGRVDTLTLNASHELVVLETASNAIGPQPTIPWTPAAAAKQRFEYDQDVRLVGVVDPLGRRTNIERNPTHGRVESVTQPDSAVWWVSGQRTAGLAPRGDVAPVRLAPGGHVGEFAEGAALVEAVATYEPPRRDDEQVVTWTHQVDRFGRVVATVAPPTSSSPRPDTWLWRRDPQGLVTWESTPAPNGSLELADRPDTRYEYGPTHALVRVTYSDGSSESWEHQPGTWWVTRHTDPVGFVTESHLDRWGNLVEFVEQIGETQRRVTRYEYTPRASDVAGLPGGLVTARTQAADTALARRDEWAYEVSSRGPRLKQETAAAGSSLAVTRQHEYRGDTADLYIETVQTHAGGALQFFEERVVDYLGRVVGTAAPDPGTGQHGAPVTTFTYDLAGNLVLTTEPGNVVWRYQYDSMDRVVLKTPPLGASEAFAYDGAGRLVEEVLQRDGDISGVSPEDRVTWRQYDARGLLEAEWQSQPIYEAAPDWAAPPMESLQAPRTVYHYDALGELVWESAPTFTGVGDPADWAVYRRRYDSRGRIAAETLPKTASTEELSRTWQYDAAGRPLLLRDGELVEARRYDPLGRLLESQVGAGAETVTTSHEYSLLDEELVQRIAAVGVSTLTTRYAYDRLGRLSALDAPGEGLAGLVTFYAYSPQLDFVGELTLAGDLNAASDLGPDGSMSIAAMAGRYQATVAAGLRAQLHVRYLDNLGRVIREYDQDSSAETSYRYDSRGNSLEVAVKFPDGGVTSVLRTFTAFDALDRPVQQLGPTTDVHAGAYHSWTYGLDGTVSQETIGEWAAGATAPPLRVTRYGYDSLGRLQRTTVGDADTQSSTYSYWDAAGNEVLIVGEGIGTVRSDYDLRGQLARVLDDRGELTYTYNSQGLVVQASRGIGGEAVSYVYDSQGRMTREARQLGEQAAITSLTYDPLGRMLDSTNPTGTRTVWSYDELGRAIEERWQGDPARELRRYDAWGNLVLVIDRERLATHHRYDAQGRLVEEASYLGLGSDPDNVLGQIERGANSAGEVVDYEYTPLGELLSVEQPSEREGTPAIEVSLHYNHARQIDRAVERLVDEGRIWETAIDYEFDALGNLRRRELRDATGVILDDSFDYDALARLVQIDQQGAQTTAKRIEYRHLDPVAGNQGDALVIERFGAGRRADVRTETEHLLDGRLSLVHHMGANGQSIRTTDLDYDPLGRLTHVRTSLGGVLQPTINYRYDMDGRVIASSHGGVSDAHPLDADGNRLGQRFLADALAADATALRRHDSLGRVVEQTRYATLAAASIDDTGTAELHAPQLLAGVYRIWIGDIRLGDETGSVSARVRFSDGRQDANGFANIHEGSSALYVDITLDSAATNLRLDVELTVGGGGRLVSATAQLDKPTEITAFTYDSRSRLVGAVVRSARELNVIGAVDWVYDPLDHLVQRTVRMAEGAGAGETTRYAVDFATAATLAELDLAGQLLRTRLVDPTGAMWAVEDVVSDGESRRGAGPIWTLDDGQGQIRDLFFAGEVTHLEYTATGLPTAPIDDRAPVETWDSVTRRFGDFEYDNTTGLYLSRGRAYDAPADRYLARSGAGKNPYLFEGASPHGPSRKSKLVLSGTNGPGAVGLFLTNMRYFVHPGHNEPGNEWLRYVKLGAWGAYVAGSLGGGALASSTAFAAQGGWVATRQMLTRYLARQAIVTASEMAVEATSHALHGDPLAPLAGKLVVRYTTNVLTGGLRAKPGRMHDLAVYLGRHTLEIGINSLYDTYQGQDGWESLAMGTASSLVGDAIGQRLSRIVKAPKPMAKWQPDVLSRPVATLDPRTHKSWASRSGGLLDWERPFSR